LSSELSTLLTGRAVEIKAYPLSFKEYASAFGANKNVDQLFQQYLTFGGFPRVVKFVKNAELILLRDYLRGIYNDIVTKDITHRHKVKDEPTLNATAAFLLDSVGSPVSSLKIAQTFRNDKNSTTHNTVGKYMKYLADSFLFYQCGRFDLRGKELLKNNSKYYCVDGGMKNAILGRDGSADVGHMLENIVYIELLSRGYEVNTGKVYNKEIDFVVGKNSGEKEYVQVAWSVADENTLARELEPLRTVKDFNARILLTMDRVPVASYDGISRKNVIDWLLASY
jgi:predicted AAA+ superfamily ATPase